MPLTLLCAFETKALFNLFKGERSCFSELVSTGMF